MMRFATLLVIAIAAAGCSTTCVVRDEPLRISVAPGTEIDAAPIAEALLAHERGVSAEALDVTWKDNAFTAEAVVKGDGERLSLVLLAPQMRLATLTLEKPHRIVWERHRRVPSALEPEYALAEAAFVRLPAKKLSDALGKNFTVEDDGKRRVILHGGREIRTLERREGGELFFVNKPAEYSCRIIPMEALQ